MADNSSLLKMLFPGGTPEPAWSEPDDRPLAQQLGSFVASKSKEGLGSAIDAVGSVVSPAIDTAKDFTSGLTSGLATPSADPNQGALNLAMLQNEMSGQPNASALPSTPPDALSTSQASPVPVESGPVDSNTDTALRAGGKPGVAAAPDSDSTSAPDAPSAPRGGVDVQALMNKIYGPQYGQEAMTRAQEGQNQQNFVANLMKAANTGLAAVSKGADKAHDEVADSLSAQADQGVKNILSGRKGIDGGLAAGKNALELQAEMEQNNPNSAISVATRDTLKQIADKVGVKLNITNDMTASDLSKRFDDLIKVGGVQAQREFSNSLRRQAMQNQEDKEYARQMMNLDRAATQDISSRSSPTGRAANNLLGIEKVQQLVNRFHGDLNAVPPHLVAELVSTYASVMQQNGSVPTDHTLRNLLQNTAGMDMAKLENYFNTGGDPLKGANQGPLLSAMAAQLDAEHDLAYSRVKKAFMSHNAGFNTPQMAHHPGTVDAILRDHLNSMSSNVSNAPDAGLPPVHPGATRMFDSTGQWRDVMPENFAKATAAGFAPRNGG